MNYTKGSLTLVLGCIFFVLAGCAQQPAPYKAPEYSKGSVVAVWNLEDMSVTGNATLQAMGEFLTARVSETLKDKGGYNVIERQKLVLALEELQIGSSSLADDATRLKIGKILGAQLMVFGGYQQVGRQFRVDLRMIEVQTGAVIKTAEKTSQSEDPSGWLQTAENAAYDLL